MDYSDEINQLIGSSIRAITAENFKLPLGCWVYRSNNYFNTNSSHWHPVRLTHSWSRLKFKKILLIQRNLHSFSWFFINSTFQYFQLNIAADDKENLQKAWNEFEFLSRCIAAWSTASPIWLVKSAIDFNWIELRRREQRQLLSE